MQICPESEYLESAMNLFLLTFFVVYGSIHLYAFLRIRHGLNLQAGAALALLAFMLVLIFAPLIIRMLEEKEFENSAIVLSHVGYVWMGLLFLFFILSILFDFHRLTVSVAGWLFSRDLGYLLPSARQLLWGPLILAALIFIYSYYGAMNVRTESVCIHSDKIPARIGSLRIVQVSDVHIGLMIRESRLRKILQQIKNAQPDIVVCTGDLLDGQTDRIGSMIKFLHEIRPKYGKFAIMGNHEYYSGYGKAHLFLKEAGFTLLRGEGVEVAGFLNLIGFDDPAAYSYGVFKDFSEDYLKENWPKKGFTIFLRHRPIYENNPGHFDLQLSGHTHCGQIFPFHIIIKMIFPKYGGLYSLPGNSYLYVNRGAGTWGPPIRFIAPPEITIIDLVSKEAI